MNLLISPDAPASFAFFADLAFQATVLLLLAWFFSLFLRRFSAASRHVLWALTAGALLLLPFLETALPDWEVAVLPSGPAAAVQSAPPEVPDRADGPEPVATESVSQSPPADTETQAAAAAVPAPPNSNRAAAAPPPVPQDEGFSGIADWRAGVVLLWLTGSLLLLSLVVGAHVRVAFLVRRMSRVSDGHPLEEQLAAAAKMLGVGRPPELRLTAKNRIPFTCGLRRSTLVLPEAAEHWPEERLRPVLLHELAHVKRRDCLTQFLAQVCAALYWFHPLAWLLKRRMRIEREKACDDLVLNAGVRPALYGEALLTVAANRETGSGAPYAALAMARRSSLEGRLLAILDTGRNRAALSTRVLAGLILLMGLVALPVASLQLAAEPDEAVEEEAPEVPVASDGIRSFTFKVIDKATGEPLEGVDLETRYGRGRTSFTTDDRGVSLITYPDEEHSFFHISAGREGYVPMTVTWRSEPAPEPIPDSYTLEMEKGTPIGGRVLDESGTPVADATVWLLVDRANERPHETVGIRFTTVTTDIDGRWEYPAAPEEFEKIRIGVHHPDFATHAPGGSSIGLREFEPVEALFDGTAEHRLSRGTPLPMRILDATGQPAEGALVGLGRDRFGTNVVPERVADAEGRIDVPLHSGEDVVLTVRHAEHAPEQFRFGADERPEELRVQLAPGRRLEGEIVDPEGRPIENARIVTDTWRGARALLVYLHSDEDGRFVWDGAPEDEILVDVLAHGFGDRRNVPVRAGRENQIVLPRPATIRGMVRDARTGEPIQNFHVVQGLGGSQHTPVSWMNDNRVEYDNEEGRFEMRFTYDRRAYAVRVEAEGFRPMDSPRFAIEEGDQTFEFALEPEESLIGRVLTPDGRPVAGAEVAITTPGDSIQMQNGEFLTDGFPLRYTDGDGYFAVPAHNDPFLVIALHDTGFAKMIEEDFRREPVLALQPWARIEGEVRSRDGAADAESIFGSMYVRHGTMHSLLFTRSVSADVDAEGRFTLTRVPPGDVRFGLRDTVDRIIILSAETRRFLMPGETLRVTIGGDGRPVEGRFVLAESGNPPPEGGRVKLTSRVSIPEPPVVDDTEFHSEDIYFWRTDWRNTAGAQEFLADRRAALEEFRAYETAFGADGRFRFEDVEPGEYTLEAHAFRSIREGSARQFHVPGARITHEMTVPDANELSLDTPLELPVMSLGGQ